MVRGEREDDRGRVAQLVQRIDERTEGAVEVEDVVVLLARIRAVAMADIVRRRQRDGQDVRLWATPGVERPEPFEGRVQRELVHHRRSWERARRTRRVVGEYVRK